ncbi:hypothetical protein IGI04_025680 [Brassica rapa subsp. trilocularis]|uniref:Uncharacterized protein n=1 Tax=Brassica rapa subsp. trilocularis TaxID=1813537 RepID=A0ABQ7KU61_BRACM|nr:hypothetical protein IGI04_025680 [Brassica rapa subsp. trilocularis]
MCIRGEGVRSSSIANKTSRSWRLPVETFFIFPRAVPFQAYAFYPFQQPYHSP